jgi:hypothetical protein
MTDWVPLYPRSILASLTESRPKECERGGVALGLSELQCHASKTQRFDTIMKLVLFIAGFSSIRFAGKRLAHRDPRADFTDSTGEPSG